MVQRRLEITQTNILAKGMILFLMMTTPACSIPPEDTGLIDVAPVDEPAMIEKTSTPNIGDCSLERGKFEFFELVSDVMTYPMEGRVYLPPCYDPDSGYAYPVLYFLHGQTYTDDQWDRLGADEALDMMIQYGEYEPFIIVMPKETNTHNNQWDSKYGISLAEELVPFIDEKYQTQADRDGRAIGGLSRGAAWAMRVGMIYWETFSAIGCHSFAPFRGDWNEAPQWFREIPIEDLPRVTIDIGDRDVNKDPAKHFEIRLTTYDIPHEWHVFDGTHNEYYWSAHVGEYLAWYAEGWEKP